MSTYVYAVTEGGDHHRKMFAIFKQCEDAGVSIPQEVQAYFGDDEPEEHGRMILLGTLYDKDNDGSISILDGDDETGFLVEIAKLPEHTTHIRFVNSF